MVKCGRCGNAIDGFGGTSRADNVTRLCSDCCTSEAFDCAALVGEPRDQVIRYLKDQLVYKEEPET